MDQKILMMNLKHHKLKYSEMQNNVSDFSENALQSLQMNTTYIIINAWIQSPEVKRKRSASLGLNHFTIAHRNIKIAQLSDITPESNNDIAQYEIDITPSEIY